MSETKTCPDCAEPVAAGARLCKHCGHNFETGLPGGTYGGVVPPDKPRKLKKILIIVGAIIIALILIGMMSDEPKAGTDANGTPEQVATDQQPAMEVTAQELFAAYDANEAAAQQKYGNRRLKVSATVAGVDLNIADVPVVLLRTQNEFMSAQASLTEAAQAKAPSLKKGQAIVLNCGGVSEVIGTPMLEDCDIL